MFRRTDAADHRILLPGAAQPPFGRRASRLAALTAVLGLGVLAVPASLGAQEGTITYTHSIKLNIELPPGMAELKASMPSALTNTMVLHFDPSGSLMTTTGEGAMRGGGANRTVAVAGKASVVTETLVDLPPGAMAGAKMMFSMQGAPGAATGDPSALQHAWEDYNEGILVETREFLGRTFRVRQERPSLEWQLTTEQAMHLGYPVMKATATRDSTKVEAWFTPAIPIEGGPASYGGLPGMILLLSLDDGQIQYQATEVELKELEAGLISPPDEGREVSREEFDGIVAEKMDELMKTSRFQVRRIGGIGL